jgi:hypothetical protein
VANIVLPVMLFFAPPNVGPPPGGGLDVIVFRPLSNIVGFENARAGAAGIWLAFTVVATWWFFAGERKREDPTDDRQR